MKIFHSLNFSTSFPCLLCSSDFFLSVFKYFTVKLHHTVLVAKHLHMCMIYATLLSPFFFWKGANTGLKKERMLVFFFYLIQLVVHINDLLVLNSSRIDSILVSTDENNGHVGTTARVERITRPIANLSLYQIGLAVSQQDACRPQLTLSKCHQWERRRRDAVC